jgi:hypothetical protein
MKKLTFASTLAVICILISGCASIVDGRPKAVEINSDPSGAKFTIYNKAGHQVDSETTPAKVRLSRSAGFFQGEQYRVVFESPGYYSGEIPLKAGVNPWYFGNIAFGGLIGLLIVDPATGAMYTFKSKVNCNLVINQPPLSPEALKAAQLLANPVAEIKPVQKAK